ncbi:MAG: D-alanyl-D-alanine carboxypeptidase [Arthrospira sp. SH-MAG29]|nr:D-alanyl-D-alanine carboxypeptidase [Arthrospira sp. SH-MAG29]MBS0018357.1 D-alanyl-D-alanine carboxypeptidase [Arthrospira sp. SH-MAG29]
MLDVFSSGIMSVWLEMAGMNRDQLHRTSQQMWESTLSDIISIERPDPAVEAIVQQYLARLSSRGISSASQGVWIEAGPFTVAHHRGDIPLSAASITKIATSLAALQTWNVNHQFETIIGATGPIENGVLQGDLVIVGGGNPFFVWEEAFSLGYALNQLGIRQVQGNLAIAGNFSMNYESEPQLVGNLLRESLDSRLWQSEAASQYVRSGSGLPKPQVQILGSVQYITPPSNLQPLIRHRSLSLAEIIKQMNIYSNNPISEMLAQTLGGAEVVRRLAAEAAGVSVDEIRLINGSGLGHENQISPRASVAMFIALDRHLRDTDLTVADLLPVSGRDLGTLEYRRIPPHSAVKTGSLFDVSALAGAIPTRDRGVVWFAIINRATGLDALRDDQDWLLQQLVNYWGASDVLPITLTTNIDGSRPALGDLARIDRVN